MSLCQDNVKPGKERRRERERETERARGRLLLMCTRADYETDSTQFLLFILKSGQEGSDERAVS